LTLPHPVTRDTRTTEDDRVLLQAVAGGSTEALGRLYDRHAPTVFAIARRMLGRLEDAEEVVQDVFTQLWRQAARYDAARATVAGWVVMVARTRAIDRLRSRQARPDEAAGTEPATLTLASPAAAPDALTMSAEEARRVRSALAALPEQQRVLLELACYEGLTHSEIAERTAIPLGTVKTRMRTAMTTLRDVLGDRTKDAR
jgi:RNA polymerase sigma-70 factor (ECF subfamily)